MSKLSSAKSSPCELPLSIQQQSLILTIRMSVIIISHLSMHDYGISSANALEIPQSCINKLSHLSPNELAPFLAQQ